MNNWLKATLIVLGNILICFVGIGCLVYFTFNFPTITATVLAIIAVGMILTLMIAEEVLLNAQEKRKKDIDKWVKDMRY